MAQPFDIVAYTYKADSYCPYHALKLVARDFTRQEGFLLVPNGSMSVENQLDFYAKWYGIDRQDEWTFDSGDFPKVVFRDQLDFYSADCGDGHSIDKSRFDSIEDVVTANREAGNHFFDADTMAFFDSRIESELIKGRYFVTSELAPHDEVRRYTLREASDDGTIDTVGDFYSHDTIPDALEGIPDFQVNRGTREDLRYF